MKIRFIFDKSVRIVSRQLDSGNKSTRVQLEIIFFIVSTVIISFIIRIHIRSISRSAILYVYDKYRSLNYQSQTSAQILLSSKRTSNDSPSSSFPQFIYIVIQENNRCLFLFFWRKTRLTSCALNLRC